MICISQTLTRYFKNYRHTVRRPKFHRRRPCRIETTMRRGQQSNRRRRRCRPDSDHSSHSYRTDRREHISFRLLAPSIPDGASCKPSTRHSHCHRRKTRDRLRSSLTMWFQRRARRTSTTSRSAVIHALRPAAPSITGRRHLHLFRSRTTPVWYFQSPGRCRFP